MNNPTEGQKSPRRAKLTPDDVRAIRRELRHNTGAYESGPNAHLSCIDIARKFGIHRDTVRKIAKGVVYYNVEGD